jgi:endonuclease/exonuclease/phosphatase family metal-dependent hydrolase
MQEARLSHTRRVRLLTYNVHSCRGRDGKVDPLRIAEVIAGCEADIIALQELDVGRMRTGGADQAKIIAAHLNVVSHFHPAFHLEDEQYGDAILTALPSRLVKAGPLPSIGEPRGAIWVSIDLGGVELQVINTHFGLRRRERASQAAALLGPGWLGSPRCRDAPCVLMGDFNAVPSSVVYRTLARGMRDVQMCEGERARPTFPSRFPLLRLDHIFTGDGVVPLEAEIRSDLRARVASDHLPLLATVEVEVQQPGLNRNRASAEPSPDNPVRTLRRN